MEDLVELVAEIELNNEISRTFRMFLWYVFA